MSTYDYIRPQLDVSQTWLQARAMERDHVFIHARVLYHALESSLIRNATNIWMHMSLDERVAVREGAPELCAAMDKRHRDDEAVDCGLEADGHDEHVADVVTHRTTPEGDYATTPARVTWRT